jgi:hypothetical protein
VPATKKTRNAERSFGLSVGGLLCAIAMLLLWRGRIARAEWLGAVGALLVVAGVAYPAILKIPNAYWSRFARALGYVNSRVLLTLVFAVVFVPISIVWRIAGTDPLGRRRARWRGWVPAVASHRDRGHYARMY